MRPWVEKNGETIEKFLAAVSEADKWMRANPKQAAQVATRWIPGLKQDVAEAAMEFNIQQADRRLSANNYRALWSAQDRLSRLGIIKSTFDVNKHIEPKHIAERDDEAIPSCSPTCRRSRPTSRSSRATCSSREVTAQPLHGTSQSPSWTCAARRTPITSQPT